MKYEFDIRSFSFKKAGYSVIVPILHLLLILLLGSGLTFIGYSLVALCYNTRTEKALKASTKKMKEEYRKVLEGEKQLSDALTGLQQKDVLIYEDVFNSSAPNVDPVSQLDYLFGSDTIPDYKLISYVSRKGDELIARADSVEIRLCEIFSLLSGSGIQLPPMTLPLKALSYPQIGASLGVHMNPFYKTEVHHRGLDLIVPQGEPVFASADGVVSEASRTMKGQGRVVEIQHEGNYRTRYAHLSEICVRKGTAVRKGDQIGSVGMTGNAVAPHLHYEIIRDSVYLDPIKYIFASVGPDEYANMLFMATNTKQSMD